MKKIFTKLLLFIVLIFLTIQCKQDDIKSIEGSSDVHQHQITKTKKIDLKDFPKILNYLETISDRNYSFSIDNTSKPNYDSTRDGDNIILLSINPDNAMQSVDGNLNANFSLTAIADNQQNEFKFSFYNLIIADHGTANFSYIVEYEYDKNWVVSQTPTDFDYTTFTGAIRYYNIYGLFTEEINYADGYVTNTRTADPCQSGGGGDGEGGDNPPNDDDGDGDGGSGGGGPTVVITCGCPPAHNGGNQNPDCNCDVADFIEIYGPIHYEDMLNDPLRTPCNGDDGDDGIDPLPEECFLPNGDPIDCENPNIPLTNQELQENYFSLLMIFDEYLGNDFWSDYFLEIIWLGENMHSASDLLYIIVNQNYSTQGFDYLFLALDLLMNEEIESISEIPTIDTPDVPIIDMIEFLECFDTSLGGTITIFADQPIPNSQDAYYYDWNEFLAIVGHSFISIEQSSNTAVYGFYPDSDFTGPLTPQADSIIGDDSNSTYDVSVSIDISPSQMQQIIDYSIFYSSLYDLNVYNCTDFVIHIANILGLGLSNCNGSWPGGSGSNPGSLGEELRNITPTNTIGVDTNGGTAPQTNKNC